MIASSRSCQSRRCAPTVAHPLAYGVFGHTKNSSPFSYCKCLPIMGYFCIAPSVSVLLGHVCPPAVFRGVALVVVDAVQGLARRAISHVGQKIREVIPTLANCNSSAAVVGVASMILVVASMTHGAPSFINWGASFISGMPVFCLLASALTVATFNYAVSHMRNNSFPKLTTMYAPKNRVHIFIFGVSVFYKDKAIKLLTSIKPLIIRHPGHISLLSATYGRQCNTYGQHTHSLEQVSRVYEAAKLLLGQA